eukprot:357336-Chlamydomonas_euryale.AAC.3
MWRGAGVALPLFSLRTNDSVGVGEFLDLIKIIDLAAERAGVWGERTQAEEWGEGMKQSKLAQENAHVGVVWGEQAQEEGHRGGGR